jgi:hypothetical protein
MALVGLSEAARLTGKHPTTILRARAAGRLSSSVNPSGQRVFDTAELDRAYGLKAGNDAAASELQRSSALVRENELLHARIDEQSEVIRDLRARLDAEADERRATQARLTALLTHRSSSSVPATRATDRVSWWRRWFRS